MRQLTIFITLFIFTSVSNAQSYKQDVEQLMTKLSLSQDMHIKAIVNLYDESGKIVMKKSAIYKKKGSKALYQLDDRIIMTNDKHSFIISKDSKRILLQDRKETKILTLEEVGLTELDFQSDKTNPEILAVLISENNGIKHYQIENKNATIIDVNVHFNPDLGILHKVSYHYNPDYGYGAGKVVIDYDIFNNKPDFTNTEFTDKKVFTENKGKIALSTDYKDYEIIDQRNAVN